MCSTQAVSTAGEAETAIDDWRPNLLIVDMDLDGTQIIALVNRRRLVNGRLPVIGLTRRGDLKTKLAAFEAGVDDILTVPFAPEELLARVIALMARSYGDAVTFTPIIKVGELEINILRRTVRAGTVELHLTSLEQGLLYLLAANAGRVVTREEILDTLWGVDYVAESNIVDRQIRNLRARLAATALHCHGPRPRVPVRGHLYRWRTVGSSFLSRRMAASVDLEAGRLWHLLGQRLTDE